MNKCFLTMAAVLLITGCASSDQVRRTWVDPASISDPVKYDADFTQCRDLAKQVYSEEQEARRAAIPAGVIVGTLVGAALGSAIAPSGSGGDLTRFGAVAGGLSGAGAVANAPGTSPAEVMLGAMRECLRGRGYRTIR